MVNVRVHLRGTGRRENVTENEKEEEEEEEEAGVVAGRHATRARAARANAP